MNDKNKRQSTGHHEMHREEDAMKKKLPFTTFFQPAKAAFIGTLLYFYNPDTRRLDSKLRGIKIIAIVMNLRKYTVGAFPIPKF